MQILIGSNNPSKVRRMSQMLGRLGPVSCLCPRDLGLDLQVEERGSSAVENARLKAEAFHMASGLPVLCEDSGLYFREFSLDDPRQPGIHTRRIGGKTLTDEEMIAYYGGLSREYGPLHACYLDAYGVCTRDGQIEVFCQGGPDDPAYFDAFGFILCDTPHPRREPGWPLDSLSKDPYFGRYCYDISQEEYQIPALEARCVSKDRFCRAWDAFMKTFFQL